MPPLAAQPTDGLIVQNPTANEQEHAAMGVEVLTVPPTDVQVIAPPTTVPVLLTRKNDDKRLHAEAANRARTDTRPAMGPCAEAGFEPSPGHITAGFGDPYSKVRALAETSRSWCFQVM